MHFVSYNKHLELLHMVFVHSFWALCRSYLYIANFLRSRVLLINSLLESTKCSYYRQKIENSNTKQLFRMIDSFFTPRLPVLPTHDSLAQLVDNFNDFFIERIHGLRRELDRVSKATTSSSITDREAPQVTLSEFSQVSSTMIHHVIKALSTKSCPLDPMPTPTA